MTPRLARWRARTDGLLLVLAIGTLPFLMLELGRADLPYSDRLLIDVVNVVVLVAFAVDYLVELRLARDRRRFVRHEWTSLLIVVSQMIAVVPGFQAIGMLRALRGVRGMRAALVLLRLLAVGGATARESRTYLRKHAASLALGVAGLSWLTAAAAFTLVEDVGVDGRLALVLRRAVVVDGDDHDSRLRRRVPDHRGRAGHRRLHDGRRHLDVRGRHREGGRVPRARRPAVAAEPDEPGDSAT